MRRHLSTTLLVLLLGLQGASPVLAGNSDRWLVEDVRFQGNKTFSRRTLLKLMVTRPSGFLDKVPFSERALKDDVKALRDFYRNEGFLDAQVKVASVERDSSRFRVSVVIAIEEGPRTRVADVAFFGNRVFSDSVLQTLVKTRSGEPLISSRIDKDVHRVLNYLADRGYLEAEVSPEVRIDRDRHVAVVEFTINEGSQIRVRNIRIEGLEKVRPRTVLRELRFRKGDVLRMSAIRESIQRLYRTGLFRSVEIVPLLKEPRDGDRDVVVRVSELDFGQVEFGIGFGTFEKVRTSLEVSYGNLFGLGQKIGLRGRASFVLQRGELAYSTPWTFGVPVKTDLNGYYEVHDEPSYNGVFHGLRLVVGTQAHQKKAFRVSLRREDVKWYKLLGEPPKDFSAKNTRSITGSYVFDVRNDLFNPTRGTYFRVATEIAGLGHPGTNQFVKATVDWRGYRPWRTGVVLASALRVGWVQQYGQSTEVPIQERFFAGGARTLRGFGEKMVGPLTSGGIPKGGTLSLVVNFFELRFPIYRILSAATFFEAGNVWGDWHSGTLRHLRWVLGVGLRVHSPLGVLRLDFGLKLDRRAGESIGAVLVDMGQAF